MLDLSSCNEIPNNFTHTNRQTATCPYPWTSAYNSAPDESSGLKKATTHQKQNSYHETRPENPVTDYESVDKTKLKNILDDAMQSFSSILSPTSLMPEVNPFFLQCPLGSIGNIGHKVGKLPSIESLPYTKQGFYKDHNGILFPVDKPLHYYLPVFHDKEYSNPEDSFDLPLNEHVNNGSRGEEYSKIISKNNELIERSVSCNCSEHYFIHILSSLVYVSSTGCCSKKTGAAAGLELTGPALLSTIIHRHRPCAP